MGVSHGGTGTCERRFDEYKCPGFLFLFFFLNNGVECSNQIELVQILIIFF